MRKVVSQYSGSSWVVLSDKRFVYDGWNLVEEQTLSPASSRFYVWGLDVSQSLQGAGGVGGLLATVSGATTDHFLYDGNGNVGQLVNASGGAIDAQYEYDPYGNLTLSTGTLSASNPFRFSTKYLDTETGLYYYGYRYYDPKDGRWLTRDPIEELGHSVLEKSRSSLKEDIYLYVFSGNNPVNFVDYLGLYLEPGSGVTGTRVHSRFSKWIKETFSSEFYSDFIFQSLRKPDLIFISEQLTSVPVVWELKPMSHRDPKFRARDDRQIRRYLEESKGILGDPKLIVPNPISIGSVEDFPTGCYRDVTLYPDRPGFILYELGPRQPTKTQKATAAVITAAVFFKLMKATAGAFLGGPAGAGVGFAL